MVEEHQLKRKQQGGNYMSYESDMKVDLSRLEENLKEHAGLVIKYGKEWARKTTERDRAKEKLAVIDSEIDTGTRKNWKTLSGDIKLTEKGVASFVIKDESHIEAYNTLLDLSEEVNILSIVKTALDHRKKNLEGLVSTYIAGYWADPKVAKSSMDTIRTDEMKEIVHEIVSKSPRVNKLKLRKKSTS